jgi:hypothetical protein
MLINAKLKKLEEDRPRGRRPLRRRRFVIDCSAIQEEMPLK